MSGRFERAEARRSRNRSFLKKIEERRSGAGVGKGGFRNIIISLFPPTRVWVRVRENLACHQNRTRNISGGPHFWVINSSWPLVWWPLFGQPIFFIHGRDVDQPGQPRPSPRWGGFGPRTKFLVHQLNGPGRPSGYFMFSTEDCTKFQMGGPDTNTIIN